MTLVPLEDYPRVRRLVRASETDLSDEEIADAVVEVEAEIAAAIPGALEEVNDPPLEQYKLAARYLVASKLAPVMAGGVSNVTSIRTGDSTTNFAAVDWYALGADYAGRAWSLLEPYRPVETSSGISYFGLSKGPERTLPW